MGGIADYEPSEIGASGDGTEDTDGDGIDEGCEPEQACPCWEAADLLQVTVANQDTDFSCSSAETPPDEVYPNFALIQNQVLADEEGEGGFSAGFGFGDGTYCRTRDLPPFQLFITESEAAACIEHIADRCAAIGSPIDD